MKYLLGVLGLIYKLYFGVVFFVTLTLMYPFILYYTAKPERYPACFKLKLIWAQILQIALFIFIKRDYKGAMPDGPYVLASNHSSYLDIVFMYRILHKPFIFLGKAELLNWPMFNRFFKTMDIAVDRKSRIAAAKSLVRAKDYIDEGYGIAIFPEGTIPTHAPVLKSFKDGAFKLAIEKQVPILPVTFLDNWKRFSDPDEILGIGSPGRARVIIHDLVDTNGLTMEDLVPLRKRVKEIIEAPLKTNYSKKYESFSRRG